AHDGEVGQLLGDDAKPVGDLLELPCHAPNVAWGSCASPPTSTPNATASLPPCSTGCGSRRSPPIPTAPTTCAPPPSSVPTSCTLPDWRTWPCSRRLERRR